MKMSIPAYKAHQSRLRMENVSVAACRRSSANNRMNAASTRNAQNGNVRSSNSDALIELSPS